MTDTILDALKEAMIDGVPTEHDARCARLGGKCVCSYQPMRDMLTAAIAAREAEGWQPIETAPKDGTYIQAIRYNGRHVYDVATMRWWKAAEFRKAAGIKKGRKGDCFEDGWWSKNGWIGPHESETHWRPLPSPPSAP